MAKSLIVVESPAKARTIKKILGRGYQVLPSMGHVKDLPKSRLGVDIEKGFAPTYIVIKERKKVLTENDPQSFPEASPVPLLIIHGGDDEQIPTVSSEWLTKHLCDIGQDVSRWVYPGQSHAGVIGPSASDMLTWMEHRFSGEATPDPMTPTGQSDVAVTRCPQS